MNYLEAAYEVLRQAGQALHYREITERALQQDLIQPSGLTPEATMGSRLYTNIKQEDTIFTKAGRGLFGLLDWRPSGIDAQVQKINQATRKALSDRLVTMPPERFEALIGELLVQMGFDENTVTVTKRSGDGGIDVEGVFRAAGLTDVNAAVQVKRWKNNIQAPTVTQLRGSLQVHQQGIIITTSDFSAGARKEAQATSKTRVSLIDGKKLLDLLIKHRVGIVEQTLKVISLDQEWWAELLGDDNASDDLPVESPTKAESPKNPDSEEPGMTRSDQDRLTQAMDSKRRKRAKLIRSKPQTMILFSQEYPATSWREVLITSCTVLAVRHGAEFAAKATTIKGRKRQYVAQTAGAMITPAQIPGTDLWVETNLNANDVMKLVEKLLDVFGYSRDDIQVITN